MSGTLQKTWTDGLFHKHHVRVNINNSSVEPSAEDRTPAAQIEKIEIRLPKGEVRSQRRSKPPLGPEMFPTSLGGAAM